MAAEEIAPFVPLEGGPNPCKNHADRAVHLDDLCLQCHHRQYPLATERPVFEMNPMSEGVRDWHTQEGLCFVCAEAGSLQTPLEKAVRVCLRCWIPFPISRDWPGDESDELPYNVNTHDGDAHILSEENASNPCGRCGQRSGLDNPLRFDMPRNGLPIPPYFVRVDLLCPCMELFKQLRIPQLECWFAWRICDFIDHADRIPKRATVPFILMLETMIGVDENCMRSLDSSWRGAVHRSGYDASGLNSLFKEYPDFRKMMSSLASHNPKPASRK